MTLNKYLPTAPTNVRGIVAGQPIPMRLKYLGVGLHGEHVWAALWPEDFPPPGWEEFECLEADPLPAMTALVVSMPEVPED